MPQITTSQSRINDLWFLCDIDGTLCNLVPSAQLPTTTEEWFAQYANAKPRVKTLALAKQIAKLCRPRFIILTGRSIKHESLTRQWLHAQGLYYDQLIMRNPDDRSPNAVYKSMAVYAPASQDVIVLDDDEQWIATCHALGRTVIDARWIAE